MINKSKFCLLVEDDPDDQEFFIDALHQVSSTTGCYAVANGQEALYMLLEENFKPDYIFTDLNMPKMDGLEFIKILRSIERFNNTPVIVFSSEYSEEKLQKIKTLGVTAFYSKRRIGILKEILRNYFHDSKNPHTVL
jgi:CheY-like chemotaxis protein